MKLLTITLEVQDPVEVSEGVFKTKLTHPRLEGELWIAHAARGGLTEQLQALDENIVSLAARAAGAFKELVHGNVKGKETKAT